MDWKQLATTILILSMVAGCTTPTTTTTSSSETQSTSSSTNTTLQPQYTHYKDTWYSTPQIGGIYIESIEPNNPLYIRITTEEAIDWGQACQDELDEGTPLTATILVYNKTGLVRQHLYSYTPHESVEWEFNDLQDPPFFITADAPCGFGSSPNTPVGKMELEFEANATLAWVSEGDENKSGGGPGWWHVGAPETNPRVLTEQEHLFHNVTLPAFTSSHTEVIAPKPHQIGLVQVFGIYTESYEISAGEYHVSLPLNEEGVGQPEESFEWAFGNPDWTTHGHGDTLHGNYTWEFSWSIPPALDFELVWVTRVIEFLEPHMEALGFELPFVQYSDSIGTGNPVVW